MMKKRYNTIFFKLTLLCITIVILVCICIGFSIMNVTQKSMMETFASTNSKIIHQIKRNMLEFNEQYTSKINRIALDKSLKKYLIKKPDTTLDNYKSRYVISETFNEITSSSEDLDLNFIILGVNDEVYFSDVPTITCEALQNLPSTRLCNENRRSIFYHYYDQGFTAGTEGQPVLVMSKALYDHTTSMQYGVVYCIIRESFISNYYNNILGDGNTILLMDTEGRIVSSSNKSLLNSTNIGLLNEMDVTQEKGVNIYGKFQDKPVTILYEHIPFFNYYVLNIIDEEIVLKDVQEINNFIIKICLIMIVITIFLTFILSHQITKPLTRLVQVMKDFKKDRFNTSVAIEGCYEVEVLNNAFNIMQNQMSDYINMLLVEEGERRKAELNALQMQIHPHFLYNTLSSIKYLIYQNDKYKAANTIHSLIYLLQNTLGEVNEMITVEQEIENLKHYLVINSSRFGDTIKTYFDVNELCMKAKIPKLILQPIVENSFFHAFNGLENGIINIYIRKKQTNLICEIIDNGKGIDTITQERLFQTTNKERHFNSVGIKNVDERIKLLYGKDYGVTIISEKDCGTSVTLTIPYRIET